MTDRVSWLQDIETTASHLGDVGYLVFLGSLGMWVLAYSNPALLLLGGGVTFFLVTIQCHIHQHREVLTLWFIPTWPPLFPWFFLALLYMLNASPVAEAYGILLAYGYLFFQTYLPALVGTPYLFLSLFPEKIPQQRSLERPFARLLI